MGQQRVWTTLHLITLAHCAHHHAVKTCSELITHKTQRCEKTAPRACFRFDSVPAWRKSYWGTAVKLVIIGFRFKPDRVQISQSCKSFHLQSPPQKAQAGWNSSADDSAPHLCICYIFKCLSTDYPIQATGRDRSFHMPASIYLVNSNHLTPLKCAPEAEAAPSC